MLLKGPQNSSGAGSTADTPTPPTKKTKRNKKGMSDILADKNHTLAN